MKIVKVTYTAKANFIEHNQTNIKKVMSDLQNAIYSGINYNACLSADNKTFIHTAFFNSDDDQKLLNGLTSFKIFQEELKTRGLEVPPQQEILSLIGTSKAIFNS